MATTRKTRVPMTEQIRLINECRQSGMTDADWCRENDIAVSTFITGSAAAGKAAADQIQHRIMVIVRSRVQSRTWFPLTLFRITFRNSIQHRRCTRRTLTIHIRLKCP